MYYFYIMEQKEIIGLIKSKMIEKNIKMQELTFLCGISQVQLYRIVNNGQTCKYDTLKSIASAVGLNIIAITS